MQPKIPDSTRLVLTEAEEVAKKRKADRDSALWDEDAGYAKPNCLHRSCRVKPARKACCNRICWQGVFSPSVRGSYLDSGFFKLSLLP